MRLLVTRPEPDASAQAEELRQLGHEPILQSLLEFRSLDFDPAPLASCDAIILTSGNSLRALREKAVIESIDRIPLFCVGRETARRARGTGFQSVAATADTAEELASIIVAAAVKGTKFVHVTGEHQAFDLEGALKREGLSICTLSVYSMGAREAFEPHLVGIMQSGGLDGVILMSPRTAEVFVSLCRRHDLLDQAKILRYFCLAQSVAEKLKPVAPANVPVAVKPKREALLALLAAAPVSSHEDREN
jgi:uroporphyrinogen-III synthase